MIPIKSSQEIEKMRAVNRIVAHALSELEKYIAPGISAIELDRIAEEFVLKSGAKPNFKNYRGFPNSICLSVNDVVIHGIPDGYILKDGDIVSIDMGAVKNGFHGDAARTFAVGNISKEAQNLIDVTRECFFEALKQARVGRRVGDISHAVQVHAEKNGFSVVRPFAGHGIGRHLHEDPSIPNYGAPHQGPLLKAGYTLAIEPMINQGTYAVRVEPDGWTVRTTDKKLSAHYENTVLITHSDPEVLTLLD